MEMGAYHYWCGFPIEENGSRWHCEYGGGAVQGVGGINIFMFNASVITPLGALEGTCSFRCPDGSLSAEPNPPGAWKTRSLRRNVFRQKLRRRLNRIPGWRPGPGSFPV